MQCNGVEKARSVVADMGMDLTGAKKRAFECNWSLQAILISLFHHPECTMVTLIARNDSTKV